MYAQMNPAARVASDIQLITARPMSTFMVYAEDGTYLDTVRAESAEVVALNWHGASAAHLIEEQD